MSIRNRVKRLERKMRENVPDGLSEEEQRNFISEKAEAIEMYLKATTKREEQEATSLIDKVNEKYNHELPKGFYDRYSVDELMKLLEWADDG